MTTPHWRSARWNQRRHCLMLVALVVTVPTLTAEAQRDRQQAFVTYRAGQTAGLEALEPASRTGHWSDTVRRPVTDVIVRLRPWGSESVSRALRAIGNPRHSADRTIFAAELIVAAAGRIHLEDRAACGPWQGEISICRTECDGGAFALKRIGEEDPPRLRLLIGKVDSISEAGFGDTVRLGACADGSASGGLAPRGGLSAVELELTPR